MKCELVETVLEGAFKGDSNTVIATAVIAESVRRALWRPAWGGVLEVGPLGARRSRRRVEDLLRRVVGQVDSGQTGRRLK